MPRYMATAFAVHKTTQSFPLSLFLPGSCIRVYILYIQKKNKKLVSYKERERHTHTHKDRKKKKSTHTHTHTHTRTYVRSTQNSTKHKTTQFLAPSLSLLPGSYTFKKNKKLGFVERERERDPHPQSLMGKKIAAHTHTHARLYIVHKTTQFLSLSLSLSSPGIVYIQKK